MNEEIAALIALHQGLERQGPGSPEFTRQLLADLPPFPDPSRVVDLGCGGGAGALLLAEYFGVPVTAVDLSRAFLDQLESSAIHRGLEHLIRVVEADMGALDWPAGSVDLLWSEGAAYHLTFAGALETWRPLLAPGGVAVISELSWFTDAPSSAARAFWGAAYPTMASEEANAQIAVRSGYEVLSVKRLPQEAWWTYYYGPLQSRIEALRGTADPVMLGVIRETEVEMALFRAHTTDYGYTFYILRAR
jgi:serine/threonine-protein kinase HipA